MAIAGLKRDLGLVSATSIIVGSMIGSGIFVVPGLVAAAAPSPALIMVAWLVAGLLIFFGAVTFAELAAAMPESGGAYAYMREAYGPFPAFLNGWSLFAANKTASIALLAVLLAEYVAALSPIPGGAWGLKGFALALIAALTVLNVVGVRQAGVVQTASTVLKVLLLLGIVGLGLTATPLADNVAPTAVVSGLEGVGPLGILAAVGVAMVPAMWAYDGWANVTQVGDEVRRPQRNLPLALIIGTALVIALYAFINLTYIRVLGVDQFAGSVFPAAEVAEAAVGPVGRTLVIVAIIVNLFGTMNAVTISGPRIYYAMARDGAFPTAVERVHPRFGTPHVSIILQGAWSAGLVLLGTFEQLLNYVILVSWVFYGLTGAAVFILRRTRPDMDRPYLAWGYPVVPAVFVVLSGAFVGNALWTYPGDSLMGLILVLTGVPLYHYWTTGRLIPDWMRSSAGGAVAPPNRRAVIVDAGDGAPAEENKLEELEDQLLAYLKDLRTHGATFSAAEAADAIGASERAVYEALSEVAAKRPDDVRVGYWGGALHVRLLR